MQNQNPEQKARDRIDAQLRAAGWSVQDKGAINFNDGLGQAVREYATESGPADYVLFVDKTPAGVIEAKIAPFDAQGGLGKMHQIFGDGMDGIIDELNKNLVA